MPGVRKSDPLGEKKPQLTKDEIMVLHRTLLRIKFRLDVLGLTPPGAFEQYEKLGILPTHIFRARGAHRQAVVALSAGFERCVGTEEVRTAWRRL